MQRTTLLACPAGSPVKFAARTSYDADFPAHAIEPRRALPQLPPRRGGARFDAVSMYKVLEQRAPACALRPVGCSEVLARVAVTHAKITSLHFLRPVADLRACAAPQRPATLICKHGSQAERFVMGYAGPGGIPRT